MAMNSNVNGADKVWLWLWRFTTAAVIPWLTIATVWAFSVSERLTRIEESAQIWRKLDVIEERLNNHVQNYDDMLEALSGDR